MALNLGCMLEFGALFIVLNLEQCLNSYFKFKAFEIYGFEFKIFVILNFA